MHLDDGPPAWLMAEQAVLACAWENQDVFESVKSILGGQEFFWDQHTQIFNASQHYHSAHQDWPKGPSRTEHLMACGLSDEPSVRIYLEDLLALLDSEIQMGRALDYARIVQRHMVWTRLYR